MVTFQELISSGHLEIGDGYRAKHSELGGTGLIFLRAGHLTDTGFDFDNVERFREDLSASLQAKVAKTGDTVVTTKGNSAGRVGYVEADFEQFVYSPHLSYWRSKRADVVAPAFLRYWSRGDEFRRQLEAMKTSTDMAPYLSLTDQRRLRITLPEPEVQIGIGTALSALDERIKQNIKVNRLLEALALALFTTWFVDFDPVVAKRDGRIPIGVPGEAIDLFPSHFEDTEIGPIPQGWQVTRVDQAFELNPKRDLSKGTVAPYLDMAAMPTAGHAPQGWARRAAGSGMRFVNGDTLMARITPCLENGKTAFVDFLEPGEVGWGSTEYVVIRSKTPLPLVASYLLARNDDFRSFAIQGMTGSSGRQRVAAELLGSYKLALPTEPLGMKAFGDIVDPLFEMARTNASESRTLIELRDTLIDPLISGELTITSAEKAVGAAL